LLTVAARLLATTLLALLGMAIAIVGVMPRPAPRCFAALMAAVAVEGMGGAIGTLAALEKANSPPWLTA
jgi:hypothetical protein